MSEIIKVAEKATDSIFTYSWKIENRIEEDEGHNVGLKEDIRAMISEIQTEASRIEDSLEKAAAQLSEVPPPDPRSVEMWLEDLARICEGESRPEILLTLGQLIVRLETFRT